METVDWILCSVLLVVVIDANVRRYLRKKAWERANEDPNARPPEGKPGRAILILILFSILLLGIWAWTGRSWVALGFGWAQNGWALGALALAALYVGGTRGLMRGMLQDAKHNPEDREQAIRLVRSLRRRQFGIPMKVSYVAIGGIWEELVFRGYLFWLLGQWLSPGWNFVASTLLFGLSHGSQGLQAVATTSGIGAVLTTLRVLSGSMLLPAFVHAAHNANVAQLVVAIEALEEESPSDQTEADIA